MDSLRAKVARAKALRSSLAAELESLQALAAAQQKSSASIAAASAGAGAGVAGGSAAQAQTDAETKAQNIRKLGARLQELEDQAILYRSIAGWTCFEVDLDTGRRERLARKELQRAGDEGARSGQDAGEQAAEEKSSLALGIRIDTFAQGTFHEAYYLIFARRSQLQNHLPTFLSSTLTSSTTSVQGQDGQDALLLVKHTIPPFIPMQALMDAHLKPGSTSRNALTATTEEETSGNGGFGMLEELMETQGLNSFLSNLNSHLQAYVSRRCQATELDALPLPGSFQRQSSASKETAGQASKSAGIDNSLQAYSTPSFDTISMRWTIPLPTDWELEKWRAWRRSSDSAEEADLDALARELSIDEQAQLEDGQEAERVEAGEVNEPAGQDDGQPESAGAAAARTRREARAKRKRRARPAGEMKALDVKMQWTALDCDTLGGIPGASSNTVDGTRTAVESVREAGSTFTTTSNGRLIIEQVDVQADFKRPRIADGDVHALHSERAFSERKQHRKDLERLFLKPGSSNGADPKAVQQTWTIGRALQLVALKVWSEECEAITGGPL